MKPWAKQKGFTIVELLIVIVVIGILAAITIVAYNGIQTRASNTKQKAAAAGYYKLLQLYKAQNGVYPFVTGGATFCLGENYVDTNGNGVADCGDSANVAVNPAMMTALKTVGSTPEPVIDRIISPDGTVRAGIYVYPAWGNGPVLIFFLKGSVANECNIGGTLDSPTGSNGTATYCIVKLE